MDLYFPPNDDPVDVGTVDRRPMLQRILETDPLQQGQALAAALKNKKKLQKRSGKGTWLCSENSYAPKMPDRGQGSGIFE